MGDLGLDSVVKDLIRLMIFFVHIAEGQSRLFPVKGIESFCTIDANNNCMFCSMHLT